MSSLAHMAANILDPRYRGKSLSEVDRKAAQDFLTKYARDLATVCNMDKEALLDSLGNYLIGEAPFSTTLRQDLFSDQATERPVRWWKLNFGHECLAKLAVRLLEMPTSSAANERGFSIGGKVCRS